MVADTDNSGQKDDESQPKVTGEEPIEGEEFFTSEESSLEESPLQDPLQDPLGDVEPLGRDIPPQGSSVGRKIMTAVGITIVAVGVSMYLTHKQKLKEEAQMEVTPPSKMASITPPDAPPTTATVTPTPLEPKPLETKVTEAKLTETKPLETKVTEAKLTETKPLETKSTETKSVETKSVDEKAEKAPSADNAALAAAISKSVSAPAAPTKTETPLTAEISKSVSATVEETPKAVSTTVESASKTVSVTPETAAKNVSTTSETISKKVSTAAPSITESALTDETPAKISETTTVTATTESPKVLGRIDGLDAKTHDLSTRLDSIDKAIVVLNKTVESMEKKLTAPVVVAQTTTNSRATSVTPVTIKESVHRRVVNRGRVKNVYHEQVTQVRPVIRPVRTGLYVVRAIVPGRAWIEGSIGGGAFTVMEGDRIPGTGIVAKVDAENGEVTMDTGEVIKYGTDDQ